jgi:hypothetical protein
MATRTRRAVTNPVSVATAGLRRQRRFIEHFAFATLLTALRVGQVARLAVGDDHQELPEVMTVVELGKAALFGGAAETVKSAQGHVFLIGGPARYAGQFVAGAGEQAPKIAFPQGLRAGPITRFEFRNPIGD